MAGLPAMPPRSFTCTAKKPDMANFLEDIERELDLDEPPDCPVWFGAAQAAEAAVAEAIEEEKEEEPTAFVGNSLFCNNPFL